MHMRAYDGIPNTLWIFCRREWISCDQKITNDIHSGIDIAHFTSVSPIVANVELNGYNIIIYQWNFILINAISNQVLWYSLHRPEMLYTALISGWKTPSDGQEGNFSGWSDCGVDRAEARLCGCPFVSAEFSFVWLIICRWQMTHYSLGSSAPLCRRSACVRRHLAQYTANISLSLTRLHDRSWPCHDVTNARIYARCICNVASSRCSTEVQNPEIIGWKLPHVPYVDVLSTLLTCCRICWRGWK